MWVLLSMQEKREKYCSICYGIRLLSFLDFQRLDSFVISILLMTLLLNENLPSQILQS